MADSPAPTLSAVAPDPVRIRELRRLALLSFLLLGLISASLPSPELLVFACPFWLPYLLLWRRSPEGQKRALAWAVVAGCGNVALSAGAVVLLASPGREAQTGDYVAFFASLLLMPAQAAVVWNAIKTFRAVRQQPGEKLATGRPASYVAAIYFVLLILLLYPFHTSTHRVERDEASATATLRTLNTAQTLYAETYGAGFTNTLTKLGPPASGQPNASHADLVDLLLSGGVEGGTATSFVKSGYRFVYTAGAADADGRIRTYTITARPIAYKQSGVRSFFTDQTGVIRATSEDRAATARDAVLQ